MDATRIKWTKVKLEYNKHKNQWRMIYSAKSIPLGEDEKGIKRFLCSGFRGELFGESLSFL